MEAKVVNVNEIPVDRIISLEKENTILLQQIGELRSDKKNLEKKLEDGQKEVKIIKAKRTQGYCSDIIVEDSIETRNLGDVEELLNKKYKSQVDKKDEEIRTLTNQLEDEKAANVRKCKRLDNDYENYRTELNISHDKEVKKLKEDIKKLKEEKTDEQLMAARNEEIKDLKTQIKELKDAVKD